MILSKMLSGSVPTTRMYGKASFSPTGKAKEVTVKLIDMSGNEKTPKRMLRIVFDKRRRRQQQEKVKTSDRYGGYVWVQTNTRDINLDESRNWLDDMAK